MKTFFFIFSFSVLLFSCKKKTVVTFNACRESACTDLRLYENGTFDLEWSFPSSNGPKKYYSGKFLVLEEKVLLYTDSSFDASGQLNSLTEILKSKYVSVEARGFRWFSYALEPKLIEE
ncbi:MAG: hypothetical protein MK078_11040 [Crocinitomicaceae bacterium]|nr:hypothetical protein [Crocinitomicaceae bacterium]